LIVKFLSLPSDELVIDDARQGNAAGIAMSLKNLEDALRQASEQIQPTQSHFSSAELFEEDLSTPKERMPRRLLEPVRQAIEDTPELAALADGWINVLGAGSKLNSYRVAQALVHHLFSGAQERGMGLLPGRDPSEIVANIVDFAEKDKWRAWIYVGLYGAGVSTCIELDETTAVMPAVAAPPSIAREQVFGINRWGRPVVPTHLMFRIHHAPDVALMISGEASKECPAENFHGDSHASMQEKIDRTLRALTLASGNAFVQSWQSYTIDHPAMPYEGFGMIGGSAAGLQSPPSRAPAAPVNPELARDMYTKLKSLAPAIRDRIELATDRLRRSRSYPVPADTALDLGIATEIVLLDKADNAELSYRLSVRGGYLLGKSPEDRHEKFQIFRALYNARSAAVHKGTIVTNQGARISEFDDVCTAAIRAIVDQNEFPEWDKLIFGH
jgi:hypothetical protein